MSAITWNQPALVAETTPIDRALRYGSLDEALDGLEQIACARRVVLSPGWSLPEIFEHCAQSIEGAMQGFPCEKSRLFQATVGRLAFHLFDSRGYMSHSLTDAIPCCEFTPAVDAETEFRRLLAAIEALRQYEGPLHPHFAYGSLNKAQLEKANAMHMANHFSALAIEPQ